MEDDNNQEPPPPPPPVETPSSQGTARYSEQGQGVAAVIAVENPHYPSPNNSVMDSSATNSSDHDNPQGNLNQIEETTSDSTVHGGFQPPLVNNQTAVPLPQVMSISQIHTDLLGLREEIRSQGAATRAEARLDREQARLDRVAFRESLELTRLAIQELRVAREEPTSGNRFFNCFYRR